jgi:hypothetical protein
VDARNASARIKKHEDRVKHHAILVHVLKSVLRLMMGFSDIYCVLLTDLSLLCNLPTPWSRVLLEKLTGFAAN